MSDDPDIEGDGDPVWIALADPGANLGPVVTILRVQCGLSMTEVQSVLKDSNKPFFSDVVRAIKELDYLFSSAGARIKVVPNPE